MNVEIVSFEQLHTALKDLAEMLSLAGACEDGIFRSKLVLSELVGNALKHGAERKARVECIVDGDEAKIRVLSEPAFLPPEKSECSEVFSENGRGLYLVDECAESRFVTKDGWICVTVKIR